MLILAFLAPHPISHGAASIESSTGDIAGPLLISEFYPCAASKDEYLVIANTLADSVGLRGWSLEDGEGILRFVVEVIIDSRSTLSLSFNGSSYLSAYGKYPDVVLGGSGNAGTVESTGSFRLADDGDAMVLRAPTGYVSDFVCYGQSPGLDGSWLGDPIPAPKKGEVVKRLRTAGTYADTDSKSDWIAFREYRYGYTELGEVKFQIPSGSLTAYTSPDCAMDVILEMIEIAQTSILACSYELSSPEICRALARAVGRGVDVHILVDGAPSGGMASEQVTCLSFLASCGARVSIVKGDLERGIVGHVGPMHAKYIVTDSSRTLIQSENLVATGVPSDRIFGNRGWGILAVDDSMARYVKRIFDSDTIVTRPDVSDWRSDPRFDAYAVVPQSKASDHPTGMMVPLVTTEPSEITLHPSPDSSVLSPFLLGMVESARTIWAEQFQLDLYWDDRSTGVDEVNPLVTALVTAMEAGATARLLCDSTWFNLERNSAVVEYLGRVAAERGLSGEFKLIDGDCPVTVLHNKAVLMDGERTVISSNNWVWSSFARNRELAATVRSREIAAYFAESYTADWWPDRTPPIADAGLDVRAASGGEIVLSGNASRDDRIIASCSWDLYADGSIDGRGESIAFNITNPGTYKMRLIVEDSWGNKDTDDVLVTVVGGDSETPGRNIQMDRLLWLVPFGVAAIVLLRGRKRKHGPA